MSATQDQWFTEFFDSEGTGFSLRINSKLEQIQSPYQKIEIYDTDTFGKLMVIDGCVMLTTRDNFLYHEMMTHPALYTHGTPKKVVIIGGGDCGTLKEVLRHKNVQDVWQIDIDEQVTRLSEKYFPELCAANDDPRAHIQFEDGVKFIQEIEAGSIDLIIVDSTDPVGPAEGLFKQSFFEDCYKALAQGGILVQQSESPLLHIKTIIRDLHTNMTAAGFSSVNTLPFPQPVYPSGWWSCTMAGKEKRVTSFDETAAENKSFSTEYYNAGIHRGALTLPEFMRRALETSS